jgi:putative nucleotidyltransferase with HDIG domain
MNDAAVLAELERMVRETYQLWDEDWVGFSWRNYTYDHIQRVRALSRTLARREGADVRALELATLLHDITKSYDGEIIMKDGQRVLDANGFWRNDFLPPARENAITRMYDEMGLKESVHHESGARIAAQLLADRGYSAVLCAHVAEIIRSHLKVTDDSSVEGAIIYDADTIDSNIGLPALYRNLMITLRQRDKAAQAKGHPNADDELLADPEAFLRPWILERLPNWVNSKHRDFVVKMTTESAKELADARIERLGHLVEQFAHELSDFDASTRHGRLGVLWYFARNRKGAMLSAQLDHLEREGLAGMDATAGAAALVACLREEAAGIT